jgi:hypothetical protein
MAMGGVGEAALLGAVMGGGSAMLTGGDPLKGAMMGGLTGGAGAGISGLLPGATAATTVLPQIAPAIAPEIATAALAPEIAASTATNAVTSQVAPVINPTASALPNFPTSATPIPPYVAQPTGGISDLLSKSSPTGYFNADTITQAQDSLIRANPGYSPDVPTQFQQHLQPPTPQSMGGVFGGNISPLAAPAAPSGLPSKDETFSQGMKKFMDSPIESIKRNQFTAAGAALAGANAGKKKLKEEEEYAGPLSRFKYNPDSYLPSGYADGGIATLDSGGYDQMVGEEPMYMSNMASGGIADLGSYSDGGRMLRGPGDGMSDSIPANIAGKRPARLADGEFVIPADVVSHLGNGSTDAGAKQLYAMMDKVRKARTGRKAQGREINPRQYMAA